MEVVLVSLFLTLNRYLNVNTEKRKGQSIQHTKKAIVIAMKQNLKTMFIPRISK